MLKRFWMFLLLLVAVSFILMGCSDKDESLTDNSIRQTPAMVPNSASDTDLEEIDSVDDSFESEGDLVSPDTPEVIDQQSENRAEPQHESMAGTDLNEAKPASREVIPSSSEPGAESSSGRYSLQLGSFTVLAIAEEKAADLRKLGHGATIEQAEVAGQLYHRLFIRGIADRKSAEKLGEELHSSLGFSYLVKRK